MATKLMIQILLVFFINPAFAYDLTPDKSFPLTTVDELGNGILVHPSKVWLAPADSQNEQSLKISGVYHWPNQWGGTPRMKKFLYALPTAIPTTEDTKKELPTRLLHRFFRTATIKSLVESAEIESAPKQSFKLKVMKLKNNLIVDMNNIESFHPKFVGEDFCFDKKLVEGMIDEKLLNNNSEIFICESQLGIGRQIVSDIIDLKKVSTIKINNSGADIKIEDSGRKNQPIGKSSIPSKGSSIATPVKIK